MSQSTSISDASPAPAEEPVEQPAEQPTETKWTGSKPEELCFFLRRAPAAVKIRFFTRVAQFEDLEWRNAAISLLGEYSGGAIADAMEPPPASLAAAAPKARRKAGRGRA